MLLMWTLCVIVVFVLKKIVFSIIKKWIPLFSSAWTSRSMSPGGGGWRGLPVGSVGFSSVCLGWGHLFLCSLGGRGYVCFIVISPCKFICILSLAFLFSIEITSLWLERWPQCGKRRHECCFLWFTDLRYEIVKFCLKYFSLLSFLFHSFLVSQGLVFFPRSCGCVCARVFLPSRLL